MKVRYRARALREIDEIFDYLRERSPSGALKVLHAIRAGVRTIGDNPQGLAGDG
jgi:toxin ParE1/3/4